MNTQNLLIELLTEELPPKALKRLAVAFADGIGKSLQQQCLTTDDSRTTTFATPRRLAVHLTAVLAQAPEQRISQKLMPVKIGLDAQEQATPALLKKLATLGVDATVVPQLKQVHEGHSDMLFLEQILPGKSLLAGLQTAFDESIQRLPIPKVMAYQLADGWQNVHFVRPVHSLLALHGDTIIPIQAFGLTAGNTTQGHRFEAKTDPLVIEHADHYEARLQNDGAVIPSFDRRCELVWHALQTAAQHSGLEVVEDAALLDEVTALVERPNVLTGTFPAEFLQVPAECLILTMKANQKYFPLMDAAGKLANRFLIIANVTPTDATEVITGNERVIRSRLADAQFFFEHDRKTTLASRLPGLNKVIYHHQLGSQGERIAYLCQLAQSFARQLGGDALAEQTQLAASLAKADLLTDMVGEFPELQGIMGRYYAQHEGMSNDIAYAIEDHYKPRFAGDELPRHPIGICVALADKLETLVSMFSIGLTPSGDKDPYALRRHSLGVIRILIEKNLPLKLDELLETAIAILGNTNTSHPRPVTPQLITQLQEFFFDRLAYNLREQGYRPQEIEAVLNLHPQRLDDIPKRLSAVRAFAALPEAASLAAANKRVSNILKKSDTEALSLHQASLCEPAEITLHQVLSTIEKQVDTAFSNGDYVSALQMLAALKAPVDHFFDEVLVNSEDPLLRQTRLALLAKLQTAMNRVADIACLAG